MQTYLLLHRHAPDECRVVFAAWSGFPSPLRHQSAHSSCPTGGHYLWWTVEAIDADTALQLLPSYVAARTETVEISEVMVP